MGETLHTLQEFMAYTKGVTYILIIAALCGLGLFYRFLTGRDSD